MYEVGTLLTNDWEVSEDTAIVVEIMQVYVDEDDDRYYVIKCREQESNHGWMWVDDVDFECEAHLDKYYRLVKE